MCDDGTHVGLTLWGMGLMLCGTLRILQFSGKFLQ